MVLQSGNNGIYGNICYYYIHWQKKKSFISKGSKYTCYAFFCSLKFSLNSKKNDFDLQLSMKLYVKLATLSAEQPDL